MAFPPQDMGVDPTLIAAAAKAAEPEHKEPGPGDVGPSVDQYGAEEQSLVTLQMTEDEVGEWWKRIERARSRVKNREAKWDILLNEYQPIVEASGTAESVKVNGHFRDIHTKIGQLFYRSPELQLEPQGVSLDQVMTLDPMTGQPIALTAEDVVTVKQSVLNKKLGRDGINASRLMDELLFDDLGWSGIGASKLGYQVVMKPVQKPVMVPGPATAKAMPGMTPPAPMGGMAPPPQQPSMQPLIGPDGQPVMQTVRVPIFEEWYWRRFSPKKVLWNDDLRSTRYDEDATWMGMEFYMSPKKAMKALGLTEAEASKAAEDDRVHQYTEDKAGADRPVGLVHGVELFLKACHFTDEPHPQAINQLILIEGIKDRPIVYRPSPDQEFDQDGRLTEDSLLGFPIQVLTIRDLADSPFPPSDSAFTNSQIKAESTFMRQSVMLRDAAIGKYLADGSHFEAAELEQIKHGAPGEVIITKEGALQNGGDKLFTPTAKVTSTPDDWRTQAMLKQDRNETLGISGSQAGTPEDTVRSATEIATIQTAVAGRNEKEQSRAVDFYLTGVRKIDSLLMRYATATEYIQITGEDGAKKMMQWNNKIISGKWMYDITPDSQMRVDTARDREQLMRYYNLTAPDPLSNRLYILKQLSRKFGLDPSKATLNPAMLAMQVPHGGKSTQGDEVNKHQVGIGGGSQNAPGSVDHRQNTSAPDKAVAH